MPTKRQFDLVIITILLVQPVKAFAKMWAARKAVENDSSPLGSAVSGAVRIVT